VPIRTVARVGTALAVVLALAACTSSSASHPAAAAPTASTLARTADLATGNVHLTDYAINTDGPSSSAILTGAIGDYGTGETVKPDGSPDSEHTGDLRLTLKKGGFRLDTAALDARLVTAYRTFPADPHTCSGSVTVSGTAPVVSGSGTGAYAHVHGTFDLAVTVDEVDAPPCDGTGAFVEQTIITTGTGTVSGVVR
jgi:hypothetical protein